MPPTGYETRKSLDFDLLGRGAFDFGLFDELFIETVSEDHLGIDHQFEIRMFNLSTNDITSYGFDIFQSCNSRLSSFDPLVILNGKARFM